MIVYQTNLGENNEQTTKPMTVNPRFLLEKGRGNDTSGQQATDRIDQ
jgi:hypothetical protein